MASALILPLVPVEEYLTSGYHPDMEYVDGILLERGVPTIFHALLQSILIAYFRQLEKQFRIKALSEVRTQIVQSARYRIPDIMLCATPMPKGKIMNATPVAVIEILSPDDRVGSTLQRFRDYASIGVTTIVQMDPESRIAHRFESGSLIETAFTSLRLPHVSGELPFDSSALFEQLRLEHEEATQD